MLFVTLGAARSVLKNCAHASDISNKVALFIFLSPHPSVLTALREYGFSPTTADELVELDKDFAFTYPGYPSSPCTSWPMC